MYGPEVQRSYGECAEGYGFKIDPCPPSDPQKKVSSNRASTYINGSFLPLREFCDLAEQPGNCTNGSWVRQATASTALLQNPLKRFADVEKSLLATLPDVPPQMATWIKVKVHRDIHVQFDYNDYSVPFRLVGQTLWLKASDSAVTIYLDHEPVAIHAGCKRQGDRKTVPDHMPPEAQAWLLKDTQWCRAEAERARTACAALARARSTTMC